MTERRISELLPSEALAVEMRVCARHGAYEASLRRTFGIERWSVCVRCLNEQREAEAREDCVRIERENRARRDLARFTAAGIPERYFDATFENYETPTRDMVTAKARVQDFAGSIVINRRDGRCIVMAGRPGTGKTHLGMQCLKAALNAGLTALYRDWGDLMLEVRASYTPGSKVSELDVISHYIQPDVLFLDEVGKTSGSDAEKGVGFTVLNKRYLSKKTTILASNLTFREISEFVGTVTYDRLREKKGVGIKFEWDSHRKNAIEAKE